MYKLNLIAIVSIIAAISFVVGMTAPMAFAQENMTMDNGTMMNDNMTMTMTMDNGTMMNDNMTMTMDNGTMMNDNMTMDNGTMM
ncbi:MAG: hypothetical protein WKF36_12100, partial [Candidatus Nitrosocosmicus sp.]